MVKKLITDISEEDFRKLNLKGYRQERLITTNGNKYALVEVNLNDVLDEEIKICLDNGYASDKADLECPVTIAIHEDPTEADYQRYIAQFKGLSEEDARHVCRGQFTYLDKFMNRFTGAQTYQLGFGIKHLYSTRDYYECRDDDYWRVRKDETKVIYRIRLSEEWIKKFELKHKSELIDWPYDEVPQGADSDAVIKLKICYDKVNGEWVERSRYCIFDYGYKSAYIHVDDNGKEIRK